MIASVSSATILGAGGFSVQVEVHVGRGLPGFSMLGLPDEACREARDRVRAAVLSSGLNWPDQKITVNLAPPHHRKTGSGLDLPIALGIDTAAHRGAMSQGSTVAVVGCGLDRCYPTRHQELFDEMCKHHLVLSEWPPGIPPAPYRFPMRNRLIAALAELLIVVESDSTGGSLIKAREALERGREVMAVSGSPRVATSRGTNALIRDGATPVTCVDDVIQALGITDVSAQQTSPAAGLHENSIEIVHLLKSEALTLGQIVDRLSLPIGETVIVMSELVQRKIITETNGWFELAGSMLVSGGEL